VNGFEEGHTVVVVVAMGCGSGDGSTAGSTGGSAGRVIDSCDMEPCALPRSLPADDISGAGASDRCMF
jgi:hypothetical protein